MGSINDLKERVFRANLELDKHDLVVYTFGNVSGIDRERGIVAIKPSGVSYEDLTADMIVLVDLDNNIIEGDLRPSSDTKTHLVLYNHFQEIGGVVHTHAPFATSWAQSRKPIPCLGTTHADYVPGEIPCTDIMSDEQIKRDYEKETGNQIIETFKKYDYRNTPMVIVASHGPFTWGDSPEKAVYHSVILEYLAKMALNTIAINPDIPPVKDPLINKHFQRKHGKNAYYGQETYKK
jgi:L-ribulose-5-phosphate 4-epimerase